MPIIGASIRRMLEIGGFVAGIAGAGDAGPGSLERRRRETPYAPYRITSFQNLLDGLPMFTLLQPDTRISVF
jgi:hypothetical protein